MGAGPVRTLTIQLLNDQGKVLGEHFFAQEKIVIGRILSADLKIDDPSVSRVHALLEVMPSRLTVTDLASAHGTFIETNKVLAGELKMGQRVRVGNVWLQVNEGTQDKVPKDFRQKYTKDNKETPPLGTPQASKPRPGPPGGVERRVNKDHPKEAPKRRYEDTLRSPEDWKSPRNFTTEMVRGHEHVIGRGQSLSMTVYWYENIIDESILREQSTVLIGEGPRNDFIVPMGKISPTNKFPLVQIKGGQAVINVHSLMNGHLRLKDKNYKINDLEKVAGVTKKGDRYQLSLGQKDFAKIEVGTITFFLIYVPEPPPPPAMPFWEADPKFRRTAAIALGIALFIGLLFGFLISGNIKHRIEDIPERFRPLIVNPKKAQVVRKARIKKRVGNEGEGEKAKDKEGKRGEQKAKKKKGKTNIPKGRQKAARRRAKAKRKVVRKGVLGALRGGLGSQLGKALKGGSGGDPLNKLTMGLGGPGSKGSSYGTGTALKGKGYGGGGRKVVGIGGLGTKGRGFGRKGLGGGSIPGKGEASISTLADNVQVLGSLPKEVIERVINRNINAIKYCYEAELQRYPGLKGKVVLKFTIGGNGRVTQSSIRESTMNNRSVENCIRTASRRWIFPKPAGGGIVVISAYPFIFSKGK